MYSSEENNGALPKAFKSWFDLLNEWLGYGIKKNDIFEYCFIDEKGTHKRTFTADYVKARCFDEQTAQPFTFHEIIAMENSAKQHMPTTDSVESLARKLSAHRSLAQKLDLW